MGDTDIIRCEWARVDEPLYTAYHDDEWGLPVYDDRLLFEFLILEGAQAGLSWITILRKREGYRAAFDGFAPELIARYDGAKIAELMSNPGIVRNQAKIQSAVGNAQAFLKLQDEFGSAGRALWQFVDGKPKANAWGKMSDIPAETPESRQMSAFLRKRGFRFVGPTICYAFMQAVGMVNDHTADCFRYTQVQGEDRT